MWHTHTRYAQRASEERNGERMRFPQQYYIMTIRFAIAAAAVFIDSFNVLSLAPNVCVCVLCVSILKRFTICMFKWRWKRINALQYGLRNLWLVSVPMDCLFICFDFRFTLSHTDTHIVDCHKHMSETLMLRLSITSLRSSSLVPYSTMRIAWGFDTQCCTFMCVHLLCMPMWLWIWTNERTIERASECVC